MNPIIDARGNHCWYNEHGELHRTDGPAMIYLTGSQFWYLNDELHRADGPAVDCPDGYQLYFIHGKQHRTDGPASICPDGTTEYWIHGNLLTEDQFNDIIQSEEHLNWYLLQL